jgi:hypothetical protein
MGIFSSTNVDATTMQILTPKDAEKHDTGTKKALRRWVVLQARVGG